MGRTLRTKIMSGVVALLFLFAAALAVTLYMVYDSDSEVAGINEFHLPILTRLNSLDVKTYELEVLPHRLLSQNAPSIQQIEEVSQRAKQCHDEIDKIFKETILLCERGSQDPRNDLTDRLGMARLVGSISRSGDSPLQHCRNSADRTNRSVKNSGSPKRNLEAWRF